MKLVPLKDFLRKQEKEMLERFQKLVSEGLIR